MHAAIATKDLIMFMVGVRVVCNRQEGEKYELMLRGSNINVCFTLKVKFMRLIMKTKR